MAAGQGLQVVKLERTEAGGRWYRLDEQALRELLLRPDVADRAVAVVSVAGAYRTGKSFLLDYFLRYLRAEPQARADGSWLGAPDEPLTGFSWRAGSEPDTTGLLLWSQPLSATLPTGEQITLLLMDTQGSFDNRSTVRDCSTIFALSTLISSVQIYNLKEDIREDSLQHLQLFTEYGKLVTDSGEEKPFQALKFLIRDWCFDYEHAFGTGGGAELLEKRLKVDVEQPRGLQELRQSIMDCFDEINCFLMPHPGLTVSNNPRFDGRLSGILPEFQDSLAELVTSIFKPENLVIKMINGRSLKGQDLLLYFTSYLEAFNSNELPEPRIIREATAEAGLAIAASEARAQYTLAMEHVCDERVPSVPRAALRAEHERARDTVVSEAATVRTMASARRHEVWLEELKTSLDNNLQHYESINNAKIQRGFAEAKHAYEECITSLSKEEDLCLHQLDLDALHAVAKEDAMRLFDASRTPPEGGDDDRAEMLEYVQKRYLQLQELNSKHNSAAVFYTRQEYDSSMDSSCGRQPCMPNNDLQVKHDTALRKALDIFASRRSRSIECAEDSYMGALIEYTEDRLQKLREVNERNNKSAARAAVSTYEELMEPVCGEHLRCLHPRDLSMAHDEAARRAMREFYSMRTHGDDKEDSYTHSINIKLGSRYARSLKINTTLNEAAVKEALDFYCHKMKEECSTTMWTPGNTVKVTAKFDRINDQIKSIAKRRFFAKRQHLRQSPLGPDSHLDKLEQMLEAGKRHYMDDVKSHLAVASAASVVAFVGGLTVAIWRLL